MNFNSAVLSDAGTELGHESQAFGIDENMRCQKLSIVEPLFRQASGFAFADFEMKIVREDETNFIMKHKLDKT